MSSDKAVGKLKKSDPLKCELVVRDRPFERTVTMQKDSSGHVGFLYRNGKITDLVKDSSAARNGLLTEHHMCEVNGQNVVGMKDKYIGEVLKASGTSLTVTVMPEYVFDHIVKKVSKGLFKQMDHSIPDV
jgi:syntenin-1